VSERETGDRDETRHLAAGAGAPIDPGSPTAEPQASPGDVVRAVAEFVEDLVEDAGPEDGDSR
jgi:hypothetical protein